MRCMDVTSAPEVRDARVEDYPAFCRFFPLLGVPEDTPSPELWREVFMPGALMLEREGEALAYGRYERRAGRGHVTHLVVDPSARRQRMGERMMRAMAERLRRQGHASWGLNVKPDNAAAIALYEGLGLRPEHRSRVLKVTEEVSSRLPRGAKELRLEKVRPEGVAEISRATGIHVGQLEIALARSSDRVFAFRCEGEILGGACVRLAAGAVFPFALAEVSLLGSAVRAISEHPDCRSGMNFSVEHGLEETSPIAEALEAAGAPVVMEILYMVGELPGA